MQAASTLVHHYALPGFAEATENFSHPIPGTLHVFFNPIRNGTVIEVKGMLFFETTDTPLRTLNGTAKCGSAAFSASWNLTAISPVFRRSELLDNSSYI